LIFLLSFIYFTFKSLTIFAGTPATTENEGDIFSYNGIRHYNTMLGNITQYILPSLIKVAD